MNQITLELLSDADESSVALPLAIHIHKRIERFFYVRGIDKTSVPISYLESDPLDSWKNVHITNRTYGIPGNAPRIMGNRLGWTQVTSTSYSGPYKEVLFTNRVATDERGRRHPLFWKHVLPDDTVEASLYMVENGNRIDVDSGYEKDLDACAIYTNYKNFFNPDTGAHRLYFIVSSDEDGVSTRELLNPVPAVAEATWEDIDLDTGEIQESRIVFTREAVAGGWTFYFSQPDTYFVRPYDASIIQPIRPSGKKSDELWKMSFSHGEFYALTNSQLRRYWLPEYDVQPFFPAKPLLFSTYQNVLWVNNRTLSTTRKDIKIDPDDGLHFSLMVFDAAGEIVKAFSTNVAMEGERVGDEDVFYETDKVLTWDNSTGLIVLGIDLLPGWEYRATYFYEAKDYEYSYAELNPVINRNAQDYMYVFYMVPDVDEDERAIYHLVVDRSGRIVYCSQEEGVTVPNLQLFTAGGAYNSDTVVGMLYASDTVGSTFLEDYCVGGANNYAYYVLAEVIVLNTALQENIEDIPVERVGGIPVPSEFANVIRANPRILQSYMGYGEQGQEVAKNGVVYVRVPITMLEDYGGDLTEDRVVELLRRPLHASVSLVVDYEYPASQVSVSVDSLTQTTITATWEGDSLTYSLYRRPVGQSTWILLATQVDPAFGDVVFTDTTVSANQQYQYGVRITEAGVEYPFSNTAIVLIKI